MSKPEMVKQFTNDDYWDCECEHNYIHAKTDLPVCPVCGAKEEDSPDSMTSEVEQWLQSKEMEIHDEWSNADTPPIDLIDYYEKEDRK